LTQSFTTSEMKWHRMWCTWCENKQDSPLLQKPWDTKLLQGYFESSWSNGQSSPFMQELWAKWPHGCNFKINTRCSEFFLVLATTSGEKMMKALKW